MATVTTFDPIASRREDASSARTFACAAVGLAVLSAVLAGWAPLGFSIVTVFLFAAYFWVVDLVIGHGIDSVFRYFGHH